MMSTNCEFIDSNFQDLDPLKKMGGKPKTTKVVIGRNVFLGSNIKVMKGAVFGDKSVIANNVFVTKSISANVIASGNSTRVSRFS